MNSHAKSLLAVLVSNELAAFHEVRTARNRTGAWHALERAHILSQANLRQHLRVHFVMLGYAARSRDFREVAGQAFRIMLAPLGTLTGQTPVGNTGRSNVSAFEPMAVPPDIQASLDRVATGE